MKKDLINGRWNIVEMEMWDEDYFNMEEQAFIQINDNGNGQFKFGLVNANLNGNIYSVNGKERYEFTWDGYAEMDDVFGFGWFILDSYNKISGEIRFHRGDSSTFTAIKADSKELDIFNIENQERRIAKIIGDPSLSVNTETLTKYLHFFKRHMLLPHRVTGTDDYFSHVGYKGKTPSAYDEFELIGFEEDIEEYSNIFGKVRRLSEKGGIFSLQLFEFESLDKNSTEDKILSDYSYWISHYL